MTELEIPPDVDEETASELVREFVDVGDEVEVWDAEMTRTDDDDRVRVEGAVTGFEPAYLELDNEPLDGKSVRYDEIHTVIRLE